MTDPNYTSMKDSAIAMHELYISMRAAGFQRREALVLLSCIILNRPLDP